MPDPFLTSVTRNADIDSGDPVPVPRSEWETGDYVVGEVQPTGSVPYTIEDRTGRSIELIAGDRIVGALGRRVATLELVGDWTAVGDDLELDTLTAAGVLGRVTSAAVVAQPTARLRYLGHVKRDGEKVTMAGEAPVPSGKPLTAPVVLLIGTSMDAGKTVAGRAAVRCLHRRGLRVVGTKLTGVGRYRDVLSLGDAGAAGIRDFVDAGLPSSAVPRERYLEALEILLGQIADLEPDVVVAEAGASPLEPYNGDAAIERLGELTKFTVLCASDPYAVCGVMQGFGSKPDLVSGRAASTSASVALVGKLTGLPVLNTLDPASAPELDAMLAEKLGLD